MEQKGKQLLPVSL